MYSLNNPFENEYKTKRSLYEGFTENIEKLIKQLLEEKNGKNYKDYIITSRTKSLESFAEKIIRDGKDYQNPLLEVTDLSGVRIIVPTLKDISEVEDEIRKEFNIDEENCCNKSFQKKNNEFGYLSTHLIIALPENRVCLSEYKNYKGMKCEVQIRTYLDHAWASIEHKINYKSDTKLPSDTERKLYQLSAVLELSDLVFQQIVDEYNKEINKTKKALNNNDFDTISLSSENIKLFLTEEKGIKKFYHNLEDKHIKRLNLDLKNEIYISNQFFKILTVLDITSISQLYQIITNDTSLAENLEKIISIWEKDILDKNLKFVLNRISLIRWQLFFNADEKQREILKKENLLTENMKKIISNF